MCAHGEHTVERAIVPPKTTHETTNMTAKISCAIVKWPLARASACNASAIWSVPIRMCHVAIPCSC